MQSFWRLGIAVFVGFGDTEKRHGEQQRDEQHRYNIFTEGEVIKGRHSPSEKATIRSTLGIQQIMLSAITGIGEFLSIATDQGINVHKTIQVNLPHGERSILNPLDRPGIQYITVIGFAAFPMSEKVKSKSGRGEYIPAVPFGIKNTWQREIKRSYTVNIGVGNMMKGGSGGIVL